MLSKDVIRANPDRQYELMSSNACMQGYMNYRKPQRIKAEYRDMDSLELIQLPRAFKATNPSDKIFKLFALLRNPEHEAIRPYTQSTAEVYTRFAAQRPRHLTSRQRRPLWGRDPNILLPSWVPDWTAQSKSPKGDLHPPSRIQLANTRLRVRCRPHRRTQRAAGRRSRHPRLSTTGSPRAGRLPYDEAFCSQTIWARAPTPSCIVARSPTRREGSPRGLSCPVRRRADVPNAGERGDRRPRVCYHSGRRHRAGPALRAGPVCCAKCAFWCLRPFW